MSEVDDVVARLKAKRVGNGWVAQCPVHDDGRASLSISEGNDGRLLMKCHAGCSFDNIRKALDLRAPASRTEPLAVYPYQDEAGRTLYEVLRLAPKDFRIRQPHGAWGLGGARRVPYRLPALIQACKGGRLVFLVEGAKDVDKLRATGITATTILGGANAPLPDGFAGYFTGARLVVVLPDNDEPGRAYAARVAGALHGDRIPVRVVTLPGLERKGDVSDWLGAGGTKDALRKLVKEAPDWSPTPERSAAPSPPTKPDVSDSAIRCVTLADVVAEDVQWLWPGYVPMGKLTVVEGDPGLSKSTLTLWLAARLSRGETLPGGVPCEVADSLFVTYEDGAGDTVRPRAEAAGADLSRIHLLMGVGQGDAERLLTIPDDLNAIRAEVVRRGARLVVIDPLSAALSGKTDSYRDQDVRRALAPLARMAEETGAAVVVVRHLTKASGGRAILAGGGSVGISGAARSVLAVHRHPDDDGDGARRVLAVVKSNLAREAPSRVYSLVDTGKVARIEWGETVSLSADDLTGLRDAEDGEERRDARTFLAEMLKDAPDGRAKKDLVNAAKELGISARSLERAARALRLKKVKGFGGPATWFWPDTEDAQSRQNPQLRHVSHMGENGEIGKTGEIGAAVEDVDEDGNARQSLHPERVAELIANQRRRREGDDLAA